MHRPAWVWDGVPLHMQSRLRLRALMSCRNRPWLTLRHSLLQVFDSLIAPNMQARTAVQWQD